MKLVGSAGFEPATFAVSGRRPNQASPTLRSVLDDEPLRHRQSYSVSSFPEKTHQHLRAHRQGELCSWRYRNSVHHSPELGNPSFRSEEYQHYLPLEGLHNRSLGRQHHNNRHHSSARSGTDIQHSIHVYRSDGRESFEHIRRNNLTPNRDRHRWR